jgi:hypothetical protein
MKTQMQQRVLALTLAMAPVVVLVLEVAGNRRR